MTKAIKFVALLLFFVTANSLYAKDVDSIKVQDDKNLRFSILGGPGYTPDQGFLVGGSSVLTFDMDGMRGYEQRSIVPISFALSFGEDIGFNILSKPMLFLNQDRLRVGGQYQYINVGMNYHGVGYDVNKARPKSLEDTYYYSTKYRVNPIVYFRIAQSRWFVGPVYDLIYDDVSSPSQGVVADPHYRELGGSSDGLRTLNSGLGFTVSYDTRDVVKNPYSGLLFELKAVEYSEYFGSDNNFSKIQLNYRQFISLSKSQKGRTLGWMVSSDITLGDAPFMHLSTLGSPFDLRGYYQGQYRDKAATTVMVEYRHEFESSGTSLMAKLYDRLGFATWVGSGFMGPTVTDIEGVLPNFGAGLRVEVQPRINFRVDVGYSPHEKQALVYFNMTEAF